MRLFEVTYKGTTREVTHFHYIAWPDHGVPQDVRNLLQLRTAVREQYTNTSVPMVVHCSAGVGRTGTFIAVDMAIEQLLDCGELNPVGHKLVDVFDIASKMRMARNLMIQTESQYQCAYSTILDAVTWLHEREDAKKV